MVNVIYNVHLKNLAKYTLSEVSVAVVYNQVSHKSRENNDSYIGHPLRIVIIQCIIAKKAYLPITASTNYIKSDGQFDGYSTADCIMNL